MEAATASSGAEPPHTRPVARATASPLGGVAAYAAELLGTFMLVLSIAVIFSVHNGDALGVTDWAVIGLVHAFALMLVVYSLGGASGAHFNPAVTIALLIGRKIKPSDAVVYIVVQCAGAILAGLVTKLLLENEGAGVGYGSLEVAKAAAPPAAQPGVAAPPTGPDWLGGKALGGLAAEGLGAFMLMWAIMATAVNPRGERSFAGWVIGATLGLAIMLFGPLSGGGFNPARFLGSAVVGDFHSTGVYVFGPIIGAVLAYVLYNAIVLVPQQRAGERPIDVLD